jgi:hypothetical protein
MCKSTRVMSDGLDLTERQLADQRLDVMRCQAGVQVFG